VLSVLFFNPYFSSIRDFDNFPSSISLIIQIFVSKEIAFRLTPAFDGVAIFTL
jgi:hypothetical protein